MARPLRLEFAGATYHLLARGNERRRIFRGDGDREQFLALLERSCARYEVSLLGFVLMGEGNGGGRQRGRVYTFDI